MRKWIAACAAGAVALAALFPLDSAAQAWPSRPIKMIVPFPAGGGSDTVARVVSERLSAVLGQTIVVENRPGAGGNIGTDFVAKAAPDGYTLLMGVVGPIAVNVSLFNDLPYEPQRDFAPITQAVSVTNMLVVHPSVEAKTVKDVIDLARTGKI